MKAIQTEYKGFLFRSRLEARWAVFFDALGLHWEYEAEGFELSDGRFYLPDFKVVSPHGYITWYEIKYSEQHNDGKIGVLEDDYISENAVDGGSVYECHKTSFTLLSGDPADVLSLDKSWQRVCPRCGNIHPKEEGFYVGEPSWGCHPCDIDTPSGGDNPPELGLWGSQCYPHKGALLMRRDDSGFERYKRRISNAVKAARSARFEHGENV